MQLRYDVWGAQIASTFDRPEETTGMRLALMVVLAAGGLLTGMAATSSAEALPVFKSTASGASNVITDARYGPRRSPDRIYRGFYGRPFIGYGAYYGAGFYEGCEWIRRRALATGPGRYWWSRYQRCIDKNY
jgi:hypothetical protein